MYMKLYASGLFEVADKHLTNIHTHANDTRLYVSLRPTSQTNADNTIEKCIVNVHNQMVLSCLLTLHKQLQNQIYDHRFLQTTGKDHCAQCHSQRCYD